MWLHHLATLPTVARWIRSGLRSQGWQAPVLVRPMIECSEYLCVTEWHAKHVRCSMVVSISACHAEDPGSIPGGGVLAAQEP